MNCHKCDFEINDADKYEGYSTIYRCPKCDELSTDFSGK